MNSREFKNKGNWANPEDGIKQLYALYLSDNQTANQKIATFFAVNSLLALSFQITEKSADAPLWIGPFVGLLIAIFGMGFNLAIRREIDWTTRYRIWYRRQIESTKKFRRRNLFPSHKALNAVSIKNESKSATHLQWMPWAAFLFWIGSAGYYLCRIDKAIGCDCCFNP